MAHKYKSYILLVALFVTSAVHAQSFKKGSLLVSLSEGATFTDYNTSASGDVMHHASFTGNRDPLSVEYGITKHWGLGLTSGGDILMVDPAAMYGYDGTVRRAKTLMSDFTVDANYHFFVTRRYDVAAYFSFGGSGLSIKGVDGEGTYQYTAKGGIVRLGAKLRYYVGKRFSLLGIVSAYSANLTPINTVSNTFGNGFATRISGFAAEFGIGFRFLK